MNESMHVTNVLFVALVNPVGAIVTSDYARSGELDVSLLERLFDRSVYSPRNDALHTKPFTNLVKVGLFLSPN